MKKPVIRWDIVVGIMTIITILCFGVIIVIDFSKPGAVGSALGETIALNQHEVTNQSGVNSENNPQNGQTGGTQSGNQQGNQSGSVPGTTAAANTELLTVSKSPVVCIDAAHGGSDAGTQINGVNEKDQNLVIANAVKKYLEQSGVKVVLTRSSDIAVGNAARVSTCNSSNAVAVVSIHRNSANSGTDASGVESWVHTKKTDNSVSLSNSILSEVNARTGLANRGIKTGTSTDSKQNYYINSHCSSPSCILQLGFMTNDNDNKYVTTELETTAKAVADGIVKYLKTKGY